MVARFIAIVLFPSLGFGCRHDRQLLGEDGVFEVVVRCLREEHVRRSHILRSVQLVVTVDTFGVTRLTVAHSVAS